MTAGVVITKENIIVRPGMCLTFLTLACWSGVLFFGKKFLTSWAYNQSEKNENLS